MSIVVVVVLVFEVNYVLWVSVKVGSENGEEYMIGLLCEEILCTFQTFTLFTKYAIILSLIYIDQQIKI